MKMAYYFIPFKVFISYPDEDLWFATNISVLLYLMEVNAYLAEHHKQPGRELWNKFRKKIDDADCVIVLYTSHAVNSEWVKKEIHIARTLNKMMIAIKEEGIDVPAELRGECKEYVDFNRKDWCKTLLDVGIGVRNLRDATPHAFFLQTGSRYNPTGDRLILIPRLKKAFIMGTVTDDLVKKAKIRCTSLPGVGQLYRYNVSPKIWSILLGFQYMGREPTLEELGVE